MFRFWNIFVLLLSGFILLAPPLKAEGNASKMMTSSPTAKLYRVDEGIFDIKLGDVIDLTDRKVIFSFPVRRNARAELKTKRINIDINSRGFYLDIGKRLDIKDYFREIFKDKDECYIDLIGVANPKGAPAIATLRFHCE